MPEKAARQKEVVCLYKNRGTSKRKGPTSVEPFYQSIYLLFKLIRQERRHIIESGRLLRKKCGGVDCACGKDLLALRLVGQGDDLVVTGEDFLR